MTVNMNQFKKTVFVGQMDLKAGGLDTSFTVRIDPDSASSDIIAGTGLKFVDGGANDPGGVPLVDVISGDTDKADGALIYNDKQGLSQPGDIVQMSYDGCVQYFEAQGALARAVSVALDQSAPGEIQALGVNAQLGILLDKALADGDRVRVLIKTVAAP